MYELFKQMQKAGFPLYQRERGADQYAVICRGGGVVLSQAFEIDKAYFYTPTLEEVIGACGERFHALENKTYQATQMKAGIDKSWIAYSNEDNEFGFSAHTFVQGSTPLEAVCCLWLALNKK